MSEKTYKTEKAIFFNKYDKISDNKKIMNLKGKLDSYAITINTYEVSALSNWNIQEALSNFICKIQHRFFVKEERYKYSEEIKAKVIEDQSGGCLGTVGCGGGFFSCGRATSD
jgi:GTPase Era involved in 16S rRNA processing